MSGCEPPRRASVLTALCVVLSFAAGVARAQLSVDPIDWTNPLLGPRYAQWLVGPVGFIATEEMRTDYLRLTSDDLADEFIARFWAEGTHAQIRRIHDRRGEEADRRFSEAAYRGRRTDRGTLFVLYGDPEEITYEQFRNVEDPNVEIWRYNKGAPVGLDGKKPRKQYRFAKDGDLTRLFRKGGPNDPEVKRRRSPGYRGPPP